MLGRLLHASFYLEYIVSSPQRQHCTLEQCYSTAIGSTQMVKNSETVELASNFILPTDDLILVLGQEVF